MLTRYRQHAIDPIRVFANEVDRLFNDNAPAISPASYSNGNAARVGFVPPLNIWHDDEAVHAEIELPGFRLEDIEILADQEQLTVRGERNLHDPEGAQPLRTERAAGRFERSITLPAPVDVDNARATLDAGILRIDVPKTSESRVKRIDIAPAAANN